MLDPAISCVGYLTDTNSSTQYLFEQTSNGVFSTRKLFSNDVQSKIAVMTCHISQGFSGRDWTWYTPA